MTIHSASIGSVIQALNTDIPDNGDLEPGSLYHSIAKAGGKYLSKTFTATGSGAQTINLFSVSGIVEVKWIALHAHTVTDSTTFSGVKLEVDDGTAQSDITAAVDASGIVANGYLYKEADASTAMTFVNPTAAAIEEPSASKKITQPFMVLQKTGDVTTYIRLAFTGDGDTDISLCASVYYDCICENSELAAV